MSQERIELDEDVKKVFGESGEAHLVVVPTGG
jgi:hypothetical protein